MTETREDISLAAEDATRFKRRFAWGDEAAVEANLEVAATYNSLMAAFSRCLAAVGESRTHGRTKILRLLYLAEKESLPQHEIGRQLSVTSANVTYLIDGMEKEGLVTRNVNQADRRVTFIELTPRGDELAARLVPLVGEFMANTCRDFSEQEKQEFIALLVKLRHTAEDSYQD